MKFDLRGFGVLGWRSSYASAVKTPPRARQRGQMGQSVGRQGWRLRGWIGG